MLAAENLGGLLGTIFFVALLVGLKLLEVFFRKITEAKHRQKLGDDVRIIEEDVRPTAGGSYLPYEETAEAIFGDYIKLRKQVAAAKAAPPPVRVAPPPPPPPRPAPAPVVEIIEDDVVLVESRPVPGVRRRQATMTVAEARGAFVASLIFGPPKARARLGGRR